MAVQRLPDRLAVILHADVSGSTKLVQQDEHLAHERIRNSFHRFSDIIRMYHGKPLELRGDALLAEFDLPSDAVSATIAFQTYNACHNSKIRDNLRPSIRVGIAMGEVIIADGTVTGAGVVLAQRVERLAVPGGLCITEALHEALPKRLPFNLENLGEKTLKGFDDSVRVYRVELSSGESVPPPHQKTKKGSSANYWNLMVAVALFVLVIIGGLAFWSKNTFTGQEPTLVERVALPLPDKPSIAVLPFINLSDDAQQEYFVDGLTEDLITDVSKVSGLFVIARNSVFTYKGRAVKVRQVAEELGVRYVMEGSVRRVGDQVRINAQLIDAITGGHLWAERYDGSLDDIFVMQDKITRSIVNALEVTLTGQEHDTFLQGWERYRQSSPEDLIKALYYFEQEIELDPDYARAHSALAAVYWSIASNGWWRRIDLSPSFAIEKSRLTLAKAMEHPSALTHQIASERAAYFHRTPGMALAQAQVAIDLDASDPAGYLAMSTALMKAGRAGEALENVRIAMRLDPHFPVSYLTRLGQAEFAMGEYENAAVTLETATRRNPDDDWNFVYLAATYGHLGRDQEAKSSMVRANTLRAQAGWGALTIIATHDPYFKWVGDLKQLKEGLRQAGVETGGQWREIVFSGPSGTYEVKGAKTIDAKTANTLYKRGVIFIDTSSMWMQGRIPGAYHLPARTREFNEVRLLELVNKSEEVVIYKKDDNKGKALQSIAKAVVWGFKNVYYFPGGLDGWKTAGYPVEKSK
jgi:TolB-like protein/class 3 adenylate cyclase/rhodanese-related sulfurtransferase